MVHSKRFEPPDLVGLALHGMADASDHAELTEWVRSAIRHLGRARVLLILDDFAGWTPDAIANDSAKWLRDDEPVLQMAIVGPAKWRRPMLTLVAQPVRRTPIRYFDTEEKARKWLGAC